MHKLSFYHGRLTLSNILVHQENVRLTDYGCVFEAQGANKNYFTQDLRDLGIVCKAMLEGQSHRLAQV